MHSKMQTGLKYLALLPLATLGACSRGTSGTITRLEAHYVEPTAATLPSGLVSLKGKATRVDGPYDQSPMSAAFPCSADFEVKIGSVPSYKFVDLVHVSFTQGDNLAKLLQKSREVTLIFDKAGNLVTVDR